MLNLKKTAFAVITMGVSGVASAGMYTPAPAPVAACTGINVTVPCESNGWNVGIQALYIQNSSVDNVSHVITETDDGSNFLVNTDAQDFDQDWTWGFKLEASYHWGTGSDVNLNWTHFDSDNDDNNDDNVQVTDAGNGHVDGKFIVNQDWDAVGTEVDNKFDAVNFEFGQTVNFGEHVSGRFHAGLQYAKIEQDITQTGVHADDVDNFAVGTNNSEFTGVGPRAGVDWAYNFGNGFAVIADTAAELLVGTSDLDTTSTLVNDIDSANISTTNASGRSIVPGAEAKLGVRYTHTMPQGDLSLEGGYQVTNYWDSVEQGTAVVNSPIVAAPGASTSGVIDQSDSNFAFQGVYLGVKYRANA